MIEQITHSSPLRTGAKRYVNETKPTGLVQTHTIYAKIFDKLAKHNTLIKLDVSVSAQPIWNTTYRKYIEPDVQS
jgi:hypothetical protein